MLAIANSGGGIIVVGLRENDDNTIDAPGLEKLEDKATISNSIEKYISSHLKYSVHDFSFEASEYEALQGRKYQIMIIDSDVKTPSV